MTPGRRALSLLVTLLAVAGVGWLSRAPYDPPGGEHGVLRLSWRLRGERVETCRTRTEAELAALPAHMRTPEVCEARLLNYRLVQQIDEAVADTAIVVPGGARGDRPLFVLRVERRRATMLEISSCDTILDLASFSAPSSSAISRSSFSKGSRSLMPRLLPRNSSPARIPG